MSTAQEHYAEGERLLDKAHSHPYPVDTEQRLLWAALAQAHFLAAIARPSDVVDRAFADRNIIVGGVFETGE